MSYLGIDIGSSQTKAVVFNGDGVQLASSGSSLGAQLVAACVLAPSPATDVRDNG